MTVLLWKMSRGLYFCHFVVPVLFGHRPLCACSLGDSINCCELQTPLCNKYCTVCASVPRRTPWNQSVSKQQKCFSLFCFAKALSSHVIFSHSWTKHAAGWVSLAFSEGEGRKRVAVKGCAQFVTHDKTRERGKIIIFIIVASQNRNRKYNLINQAALVSARVLPVH